MHSTLANIFNTLCNTLMDLGLVARKFQSGTSEYPLPSDVLKTVIDRLVRVRDKLEKACFKPKNGKGWSEIRWYKGDLVVRICYPHRSPPETLITEKGVDLPEAWELRRFKKGREVEFRLKSDQSATVVPFLDLLFRRVYNCPDDYILCGKILGILPPS